MSNINELLYAAYVDAGATALDLPTAEYQALVAAGASDGTWYTFLRTQGYDGDVGGMLYKYLGDKGYTGISLNERIAQAAAALDLFDGGGSAFDYAALFTSYEMTNGWCIDGSPGRSGFYEDESGTDPCDESGTSPVVRINDVLSAVGGAGYVVQNFGSATPVYYADGSGVRWFRYGSVGGTNRYMHPASAVNVASALTQVAVFKPTAEVSGNNASILSTFRAGSWGSGGYHWLAAVDGTGESNFLCDSGVTGIVAAGSVSAPVIVVAKRSGTGTNQSTITTYNMAGEQIATTTGTQNANPANSLGLGYYGILGSGLDCAFQFVGIGAAISAEDEALIVADLSAKFGEWAP